MSNIEELQKQYDEALMKNQNVFEEKIKELQEKHEALLNKLNEPAKPNSIVKEVRTGGEHLIYTEKGSIINRKSAKEPFIKVSEEVELFCKALVNIAKGKGVTDAQAKALNESTGSEGGYLVPDDFRIAIVEYDTPENIVWPRATVWPMTSLTMGFPKLVQDPSNSSPSHFAGVTFTWTEEGGTKTETTPSFEMIELKAKELSAYSELTEHLVMDSPVNLVNFISNLFRRAWNWTTDAAFISGDGNGKPLGVIYDPNVNVQLRVTSSTVRYEDIINMNSVLPSVFDLGAVWFMGKDSFGALAKQKDSNGALILNQTEADLKMGYAGTLKGKPVILADGKVSAMGSTGDVILGNWTHYYIGDRQEFSMDISKHYKFRDNKLALRVTGRIDGMPAIPKAFVVLSATTGGAS